MESNGPTKWTSATYRHQAGAVTNSVRIGKKTSGAKNSGAAGRKMYLGKRTAPFHTMTSTAFKTQFVIAATKQVTLPQIVPTKEKAKARMAKAKEKVAKAILERVMVHTSLLEDGKQKVDGREDTKGTEAKAKAKARAKGTRAHVGDADRSATNKVSAKINSKSSKSSKSSKVSKVSKPSQVQQRFQNNRTAW